MSSIVTFKLSVILAIALLSTLISTQTIRTTQSCKDSTQLICKQDCGIVVIRCTGSRQGVEFSIQGSGLVKCFMRSPDGVSDPTIILSTVCNPSTIPVSSFTPRNCGAAHNETTPEVEARIVETMNVIERSRNLVQFSQATSTTFDVHWHVVYPSERHASQLSASQVQRQVTQLNNDFRTYKFQIARIYYYSNPTWFNSAFLSGNGRAVQDAMKRATRKGNSRALNIWSVGFTDNRGTLGYATFPSEYSSRPWNDGVVIHFGSLPQGTLNNFNMGRTLVHEVGHWLGLFHTFQGGCFGDGDGVADTPAEGSGASGCPVGRDSCPGQWGLDPIRNFMDYSFDSCMQEFTQGQYFRMASNIANFRNV